MSTPDSLAEQDSEPDDDDGSCIVGFGCLIILVCVLVVVVALTAKFVLWIFS